MRSLGWRVGYWLGRRKARKMAQPDPPRSAAAEIKWFVSEMSRTDHLSALCALEIQRRRQEDGRG